MNILFENEWSWRYVLRKGFKRFYWKMQKKLIPMRFSGNKWLEQHNEFWLKWFSETITHIVKLMYLGNSQVECRYTLASQSMEERWKKTNEEALMDPFFQIDFNSKMGYSRKPLQRFGGGFSWKHCTFHLTNIMVHMKYCSINKIIHPNQLLRYQLSLHPSEMNRKDWLLWAR